MGWLKKEREERLSSEVRLCWYQLRREGRFLVSRATSTVFRGGLVRLDQRLRDSSDSCRSCSIIIIMNSKRCSNLKYISRSFSSGSTHFFYLIEHTYVNACMQCMLHACNVCMCVCICVCVYISVIYIISIYRHVCIYQL